MVSVRGQKIHEQMTTRDGRSYVIREVQIDDAPHLISHARTMLVEPQWNITELDEFHPSLNQEESWILSFHERPHSMLLVADFGAPSRPQIAGAASLSTQGRNRTRHRGRVGIGVQKPYRGVGVGEALLSRLLNWAEAEPELERVELSVFAHNTRAMNLYTKCGFVEEARLLRAFKLADGTYYDDVMMVKWLKAGRS